MAQKGQSKLKMTALLPHNQDNIVWYSPIWQNNKNNEIIIQGMLKRFANSPKFNKVVCIQFYENDSKVYEIKK